MENNCLVCRIKTKTRLIEAFDHCSIYKCCKCGLQFVDPIPEGVPVFEDFSESGEKLLEKLGDGKDISDFITPNEVSILSWLNRTVSPKSHILEICCESGRFLAALKKKGYSPYGIEPLAQPIEMLSLKKFTVLQGFVENFPTKWPEPAAIVLLESLVRFPDPIGLLKQILSRFPHTPLCLTVPSPNRSLKAPDFDRRLDFPPNHLTRWTSDALIKAFDMAGYKARCQMSHVDLKWKKGKWKRKTILILSSIALRVIGESEYSLICFGTPK